VAAAIVSFRRIELPVFYRVIDDFAVQHVKFDSRTMKDWFIDSQVFGPCRECKFPSSSPALCR
jgi:hypothetical protein